MQRKRSQWIETISGANAEHQIYLDESGINTNFTRHYAHAVHGKRAIDIGIANAGDGKLIPVDGFKGVHANLMPEKNSDMDSWTEISFSIVSLDFCESS